MRILYLTQYFNSPGEPGASRHFQHARLWARAGHDVRILTGNVNYKTGATAPLDPGKSYRLEQHPDGFRVYRIWAYSRFKGSFKKRLLYFASYAAHAAILGSGLDRPDVVLASSTPLTVGLPGEFLARRFRVPFVFECRDIWPEAAVEAGVMTNPAWARRARSLANHLYHAADHMVTVTGRMKTQIATYGIPESEISVVPNGVDDWMIPESFRSRNPLARFAGKFVCLYVGAHGIWNFLDQIVDAAVLLRDDPRLVFVFVGDGDHRAALERKALAHGLTNLHFLGAWPKEEAYAAMVHAQIGLITSTRTPAYLQILPNKIFDYLAAGLPAVTAAMEGGEMADVMQGSKGGWLCAPDDARSLADAIRTAADTTSDARRAMGEAGRAYVREHFWRPDLAARLLGTMESLVRAHSSSRLTNRPAKFRPKRADHEENERTREA